MSTGIPGNPVFLDDFMNSGLPQYCAIQSNTAYSLLSFNQQLIQTCAFHAHSHSEKRTIDLNESKRQTFIQGLDSKRLALENENKRLREEHMVLTSLMSQKAIPENTLKPFIVKKMEKEEIVKERSPYVKVRMHTEGSSYVLQVELDQAFELCGFFRNSRAIISSKLAGKTHMFWMNASMLQIPFYICYWDATRQFIKEIHLQKVEAGVFQDFPRLLFSNQIHNCFDGYLSPTIQYHRLPSSIHEWMTVYSSKENGYIDMISLQSTFDLYQLLIQKLVDEIALLREETNVSFIRVSD